jgi:hypothetical protein
MDGSDLRTYVRSIAPHAIHLQFNIGANAIDLRGVQGYKVYSV